MEGFTVYMCASYLGTPSHPNTAGREVVILVGFTNIMPSTCVQKDDFRHENTHTGRQHPYKQTTLVIRIRI